jgi:hypothetical protein
MRENKRLTLREKFRTRGPQAEHDKEREQKRLMVEMIGPLVLHGVLKFQG